MNQEAKLLNDLDEVEARQQLTRCCGSQSWVESMANARPFTDFEALLAVSEVAFDSLKKEDWLEAFTHHPKIGDIESLRAKFADTRAWAGSEQCGTQDAEEFVLVALAEGNRLYEEKFGYIFIICATGKSAREMLDALNARLGNEPEVELPIAAGQQKQITEIRLRKLVAPES